MVTSTVFLVSTSPMITLNLFKLDKLFTIENHLSVIN